MTGGGIQAKILTLRSTREEDWVYSVQAVSLTPRCHHYHHHQHHRCQNDHLEHLDHHRSHQHQQQHCNWVFEKPKQDSTNGKFKQNKVFLSPDKELAQKKYHRHANGVCASFELWVLYKLSI